MGQRTTFIKMNLQDFGFWMKIIKNKKYGMKILWHHERFSHMEIADNKIIVIIWNYTIKSLTIKIGNKWQIQDFRNGYKKWDQKSEWDKKSYCDIIKRDIFRLRIFREFSLI
jgi:hypothetical protein